MSSYLLGELGARVGREAGLDPPAQRLEGDPRSSDDIPA